MVIKSGEFFDLTTTSYNNEYGKLKNDNAKAHGISSTLDKYIEELKKITTIPESDVKDDKYEKRMKRLVFLERCNGCPGLQSYFEGMNTYINGKEIRILKDGTFEQYDGESNPLILICAGGNIITIFAKLLLNDINTYIANPGAALSRFFPSYLDEEKKTCLITFLKNGDFQKSVEELASKYFSDFDYNLLPNKNPPKKSVLLPIAQDSAMETSTDEITHNPKKRKLSLNAQDSAMEVRTDFEDFSQDDALFRDMVEASGNTFVIGEELSVSELPLQNGGVSPTTSKRPRTLTSKATQNKEEEEEERKRKVKVKVKVNEKGYIFANKEVTKDMKGFVLFRVKTRFLNNTNVPVVNNACHDAGLPPDVKKNLFPQMVQESWKFEEWWKKLDDGKIPCKSFIEHLIKQKKDIESSTKNNIIGTIETYKNKLKVNVVKDDLNSIIEYLHNTTKNLNTFIEEWLKTNPVHKNDWVDSNFSTLNNIVTDNDGLLIRLNSAIIGHFLNRENEKDFNCIEILESILYKENLLSNNKLYNASPKIQLVSFSQLRNELAKHISGLTKIIRNLPGGVALTINAIQTTEMDFGQNTIITFGPVNITIEHVPDNKEPENKNPDKILDDIASMGSIKSSQVGGRLQKTKKYKRKYIKTLKRKYIKTLKRKYIKTLKRKYIKTLKRK